MFRVQIPHWLTLLRVIANACYLAPAMIVNLVKFRWFERFLSLLEICAIHRKCVKYMIHVFNERQKREENFLLNFKN